MIVQKEAGAMREDDQKWNEETAPAGEQTPPEEDLPQDDCPTGVF